MTASRTLLISRLLLTTGTSLRTCLWRRGTESRAVSFAAWKYKVWWLERGCLIIFNFICFSSFFVFFCFFPHKIYPLFFFFFFFITYFFTRSYSFVFARPSSKNNPKKKKILSPLKKKEYLNKRECIPQKKRDG